MQPKLVHRAWSHFLENELHAGRVALSATCLCVFSAKAGYTNEVKKFENFLKRNADERVVGKKLFGNSLANSNTHERITRLGRAVGVDKALLQKVVERIAHLAMDSSDAASILMPDAPKVAAFLRGVSFFVFEGVFKQNSKHKTGL